MNTEDIQREFKLLHSRIGAIEERCGCKVKFKESIEERLAILEERVNHLYGVGLNEKPDPDSDFVADCEGPQEPEKPVTEEKCTPKLWCHIHGFDSCNCKFLEMPKPDKPSEFISIPRDVAEEWFDSMDDGHYKGKDPDARLLRAIKQALKER